MAACLVVVVDGAAGLPDSVDRRLLASATRPVPAGRVAEGAARVVVPVVDEGAGFGAVVLGEVVLVEVAVGFFTGAVLEAAVPAGLVGLEGEDAEVLAGATD